jgi:hypothetical protein
MVQPAYPVQSPYPGGPRPTSPLQVPAIVLLVAAALLAFGVFTRSWMSVSLGSTSSENEGDDDDDPEFSFVIGPLGGHSCFGKDKCEDMSWAKMDPDPDKDSDEDMGDDSEGSSAREDKTMPNDLAIEAKLVLIFGLLGAALSAVAGIMALTGQLRPPVVKLGKIGVAVAAGVIVLFEMRLLTGQLFPDMGGSITFSRMPSYSFFLALAGVVGAGIMLFGPASRHAGAAGPAMGIAGPFAQQPYAQQGGPFPQAAPYPQPYQAPPPPSYPCIRCQTPLTFVAQYQRWFCTRCQQYV